MKSSGEVNYFLVRFKNDRLMMIGAIIIVGLVSVATLAPFITSYDPIAINPPERLEPPSQRHAFGTDEAGRDIFSRVLYGARLSLFVGFITVLVVGAIGTIIGTLAGSFGGIVDEVIMRISDIFMAFPFFLLAIVFVATFGANVVNAICAMVISWWPLYARLARSRALVVRESLYVEAAKSIGASRSRILFKYFLPNVLTPVLVQSTTDLGVAIFYMAALGFIGLGAQPPAPEWGSMIGTARTFILQAWWYITFPGVAISISVFGFNLLGDGVRDMLDPTLRM